MENNIEIYVKNKEDFYHSFHENKLSDTLNEYIFKQSLLFKNPKIDIYISFSLSEKEKEEIVDMIRSSFGIEVKYELQYLRYKKVKQFILLLIGIISISIANVFNMINLLSEIILIAGWVCIWEFFYSILLEDMKNHLRIKKCKKLTTAHIEFVTK